MVNNASPESTRNGSSVMACKGSVFLVDSIPPAVNAMPGGSLGRRLNHSFLFDKSTVKYALLSLFGARNSFVHVI
jgi:hypothetical protein